MSDNYVVLLGTKGGPAIRPGSTMPTSNLVCIDGQKIVVDCGLGVTKGLVDQGIHLKDISLILISHLHSDHYLELGPLIHTAWTAGLKSKIHVWGPAGLSDYWNNFVESMKADIDLRIVDEGRPDPRNLVEFHVMDEGHVFDSGDLSVSAIRTKHPPLVDCFAYSFKSSSAHVVFSGDTAPIAELEGFARGADLLVHEAMLEVALPALMKRVSNGGDALMVHWLQSHTFAHDAAKAATRAGVKRLALSHLIPSDDPDYGEKEWKDAVDGFWDGPLFVGNDGLKIDLS